MIDESESALTLLETEATEDEQDDDSVQETASQVISILFDDAETYQPSSFY